MGELRFDGRVAVITGAGHGLGRSHALGFAARGAKVVVNDLDAQAAATVAARIRTHGGSALVHTADISTEEGAQSLIEKATDTFGRVDVIVNNAGILRDRSFKNISPREWDEVLAVHLRGSFLVSHAAFGHLREYGYGRIVNTTSPSGLFGNFGQSNYSAAKMGVVGLTKTLAIEGAKYDINANAIAPIAYTRMTEDLFPADAAAVLSPEKVTPLVLWLAHEDCPTTGEVYSVGGGRIARVFVAEGPGVVLERGTAEEVQDNWPDINAERPYVIPRNLAEQTDLHIRGLL
ncbi:SDR family NAD(P)-dependent oxidoreductase [Thermobifida alba]|uniref:SDR family NAD(P)-dependent oxidoreductase n=1 Tax=Thermobifida alba TaxID=53522 RepID=A0ABY4L5V0_THEAE|nr:SDR family NAD(P)-dependent oxidoreductase [Thermobifida alba]UPT23067.1 SDR family NAD(P)-dependent oxidoreductase [Thermobifida alba]